jgi:hypothetical protein
MDLVLQIVPQEMELYLAPNTTCVCSLLSVERTESLALVQRANKLAKMEPARTFALKILDQEMKQITTSKTKSIWPEAMEPTLR